MSLTALPADVQHDLLSYLPDLHVLNSLVLTSRSFYTVFRLRRDLVLKAVAENFIGIKLGEEFFDHYANEPADSNVPATIKFLIGTRNVVQALEPIVFRLLIHPDAHWDDPDRRSVDSMYCTTRANAVGCRVAHLRQSQRGFGARRIDLLGSVISPVNCNKGAYPMLPIALYNFHP
jgi:hypothetical protein